MCDPCYGSSWICENCPNKEQGKINLKNKIDKISAKNREELKNILDKVNLKVVKSNLEN